MTKVYAASYTNDDVNLTIEFNEDGNELECRISLAEAESLISQLKQALEDAKENEYSRASINQCLEDNFFVSDKELSQEQ